MEDIDLLEDEVVEQEFVINEKGERLLMLPPQIIESIMISEKQIDEGLYYTSEEVHNIARNRHKW